MAEKQKFPLDAIKREIATELSVPLWPHTGRALNLSKNPTYEAARRGDIPTIRMGGAIRVSTAVLRKMLGIEDHPRPAGPALTTPPAMPPKNTPATINRRVA